MSAYNKENSPAHLRESMLFNQIHTNTEDYTTRRKNYGGIIDLDSLPSLKEKRDMFFLLSFLVHNTKPVGHQVPLRLNPYSMNVLLHVVPSNISKKF